MKQLSLTLIVMLAVFASCNGGGKDVDEGQHERDSLLSIISEKDEAMNDLIMSINEVQEGFQRINEAEGRVTIASADMESGSARETIRENIQYMLDCMEKNRELIAQLQQRVNASGSNIQALKKTLSMLQAQLEQKGARIQELEAQLVEKDSLILDQTQQISNLNDNVTQLTQENQSKTETVAKQDKELNTAWFVFGTKAELKEQKIITQGDVLRSDDFNKNYFTEVDTRTMREIKLYSKKAELLTSHPSGSYTLKKDEKGEYVLNITNVRKFWSVSHYLVILVK